MPPAARGGAPGREVGRRHGRASVDGLAASRGVRDPVSVVDIVLWRYATIFPGLPDTVRDGNDISCLSGTAYGIRAVGGQ